uniref:HMG-box containing 3 n=1 Tax=Nothobranchius furzeri TaxID=105023 RepID=A0A8C6MH97_NOTFU
MCPRSLENMDSEEIFKVVKVSEEVESVSTQTATSLKKKRSKCQENHPEKPKKPRSAYLLYYFDVHQTMQTATPNMPQSEVNKRISESWRRLSVAEKRHYLERAKLEKEGMETSSLGSSKQLTGFRKILPRANCFLLPKGSFLGHHPGGFRPEVNISPLDSSLEGGLHSVSLPLETQLTPVGLAADAELPERHIVADVEEVEATPSVYLQRISAPSLSQTTACSNSCVSQGAADVTENGVALKSSLTRAPSSSFNGAMVRQTTQSLNTYTRRGHGRCHHPGCSFSYITRHKPSTCPECGSHLGGKWVPAVSVKQSAVSRAFKWAAQESFSGLKPSTLKQLGQTVTTATTIQVTRDLGLSTGRGRGHCKNPSCDYIYKNRHKPAVCPKCGSDLTQKNTKPAKSETLLDPHQELSPAQRDIQRQSTVQLLRSTLQYPESEADLQETLTFIQELNSFKLIMVQAGNEEQETDAKTEALVESGWPRSYESAATHCGLCNHPLFKGERGTVAGQEDVWLLTETLMQTATLQLKTCLNVQCLALHSFTDLHPGLFNIGNKLLVSIDLFLKVRANIKLGQSPSHAVSTVLHHIPSHPVHTLSPEESSQVRELLLTGYWAFESVTVRDYNDMICGFCGIAPKLEIAQRCTNNVLELKNVEFTWPESSISDEVHVDDFWVTMETEAIEQAAFPADIPITRVDASIIAPFAPPLMRSPTVINTEKDKVLPQIKEPSGDPSVLVRLIHDGLLRLDKLEENNEEELRTVLTRCGVNIPPDSSKNELLASLLHLYTHTYSGLPTAPQPPEHLTAGKLSKVCPHQVVCSSKYLVRGETARDHVDLLLSSRYWPPVYVSDCPRQVALCVDLQYPELATQMWGRNQGCFSDPFEEPGFVLCSELQDQPYSADLSLVAENQQIHPVTKSLSCWLVHPPGVSPGPPASEHHSMALCSDLEPYCALADCSSKGQPIIFTNAAYYYLHNRLVDFLTSRELVNQQISQVVKTCQPGEVVIRDALYRLGVAHINTE